MQSLTCGHRLSIILLRLILITEFLGSSPPPQPHLPGVPVCMLFSITWVFLFVHSTSISNSDGLFVEQCVSASGKRSFSRQSSEDAVHEFTRRHTLTSSTEGISTLSGDQCMAVTSFRYAHLLG